MFFSVKKKGDLTIVFGLEKDKRIEIKWGYKNRVILDGSTEMGRGKEWGKDSKVFMGRFILNSSEHLPERYVLAIGFIFMIKLLIFCVCSPSLAVWLICITEMSENGLKP